VKRPLQSAIVLLSVVLLTACALSPAEAVRRQPPPGELASLQVRQRVPWRRGAIVYYTFDRLDSSGTTISECGSATYVERGLLGWHLRGGGGVFCTPHSPSAGPFVRAGSQGSLGEGAGLHSETYGLVTDPAAVEVRVTWSDGLTETIALVNGSYLAVRADEVIVEQIEALDVTGTVVATLTTSASANSLPPASPQPTATPPPTEAPTSAFPRTDDWLTAQRDAYPTVEQTEQLADALSADVVAYLERAITPTAPLKEQVSALSQMVADLPGHGGGQVVPVNLDDVAGAELFVVPNLNGAPLLYVHHTPAGWQALPVPAPLCGEETTVAANLWPHSAEVRDVTGDGHPEAVTTHIFIGGSNWREHLQVLRWDGERFTVLFRAELVNWAGSSTYTLEPDPTGAGQMQIVLSYPYLYDNGFDHKMVNHPLGRQVWRWSVEAGRFVLFEESVDLEHSGWEPESPASIADRLQWLTNEGEQMFRTGAYGEALLWYNEVLRLASSESWQPEEGSLDWTAYAAFRRAETLLIIDLPDEDPPPGYTADGRAALQAVVAAMQGDPLGDLAQAFLDGYGDGSSADAAARGVAAMQEIDLYTHFYYERPGVLRFPLDARGILYPGAGLAAYLNAHPEMGDDPATLCTGLSEVGFAVEDVRLVEDGNVRIALRLPDAPNADGGLAYWSFTRDEGSWRVLGPDGPGEWPIVGEFTHQ